jgi:leucyl aminopeptidase
MYMKAKFRPLSTGIAALSLLSFCASSAADASFSFTTQASTQKSTQIVLLEDTDKLTGVLAQLDESTDGRVTKLLALNDFTSEKGNTLHLQMVGDIESLLIVGTQDPDGLLDGPDLQKLGGKIAAALKSTSKKVNATIYLDGLGATVDTPSAHLAYGYQLRDYSFDRYLSEKSEGVSDITLVSEDAQQARKVFVDDLTHVASGVHLARDLATEPGKNMYPQAFVDVVKKKFKGLRNVKIEVLDMRDIQKLGMGALEGVGKGSINDPRLLVIQYTGADKKEQPLALVGKGITFDTGGISLKQNTGMWAMKSDLSGAAAVAGTLYAAAQRGEAINLVGLMPLAENMPSQDAIRPGDVLETMKGVSIEIMSTDAEGRLILADAVYYAQVEFKPRMLLNIATLTGSAARALSDEYAALITRDFELSTQMMGVGERSGEHVWPLPLHPNHFEQIKSPSADIKNSGAGNPGASIGAAVVGTFIDEDLPWVHLDIAGVDWLDSDIDVAPKGSQGWGVRFMDQLVREQVK